MSKIKYHNIKILLSEEDLYMLNNDKVFNLTFITEDDVQVNAEIKKQDECFYI